MCSHVFFEYGIQYPNSKSKVLRSLSRKKCRSIIRKWLTGLLPTVNSTLDLKKNKNRNQFYTRKRTQVSKLFLRGSNSFQFQKLWRKLIPNISASIRIDIAQILLAGCILINQIALVDGTLWKLFARRLGYFEQNRATFQVTNFKTSKIYVVNVGI